MDDHSNRVLYAIVTGSPPAREVGQLVDLAMADGWTVCVIASPDGMRFVDVDALTAQTGYPVRCQYKQPGTPDLLPPADAMIVAPITCNSLAKWGAGISDTLPLGLLIEAVGNGRPVVAMPYSNWAQLSFPAVKEAVRKLSDWGVTVVAAADLPDPGTDDRGAHSLPWELGWQAVLEHPWRDP